MQKGFTKRIFLFCGLGFGFGLSLLIGSDVCSRIMVAHESTSQAFAQCVYYLKIQPIGTVLLLIPYLIVGLVATVFGRNNNLQRGCFILIFNFLFLAALYFYGYFSAQQCLLHKAWTAAALSVGLLPFLSIPIICLGSVVGWVVSKFISKSKI
jgi:hypothetical protein